MRQVAPKRLAVGGSTDVVDILKQHSIWLIVLTASVLVAVCAAAYGIDKAINDQTRFCAVQKRGLPAGHHLAAAMTNIESLLLIGGGKFPARLGAKADADLSRLAANLALYEQAEAAQPAGETC